MRLWLLGRRRARKQTRPDARDPAGRGQARRNKACGRRPLRPVTAAPARCGAPGAVPWAAEPGRVSARLATQRPGGLRPTALRRRDRRLAARGRARGRAARVRLDPGMPGPRVRRAAIRALAPGARRAGRGQRSLAGRRHAAALDEQPRRWPAARSRRTRPAATPAPGRPGGAGTGSRDASPGRAPGAGTDASRTGGGRAAARAEHRRWGLARAAVRTAPGSADAKRAAAKPRAPAASRPAAKAEPAVPWYEVARGNRTAPGLRDCGCLEQVLHREWARTAEPPAEAVNAINRLADLPRLIKDRLAAGLDAIHVGGGGVPDLDDMGRLKGVPLPSGRATWDACAGAYGDRKIVVGSRPSPTPGRDVPRDRARAGRHRRASRGTGSRTRTTSARCTSSASPTW